MTLLEASVEFRKEFGNSVNDHFAFTVCLKEKSEFNPIDTLVIYLINRLNFQFPETYKGFPVETRYTGQIEIKPSKKHGGGI